jgi:hypothetical protein
MERGKVIQKTARLGLFEHELPLFISCFHAFSMIVILSLIIFILCGFSYV